MNMPRAVLHIDASAPSPHAGVATPVKGRLQFAFDSTGGWWTIERDGETVAEDYQEAAYTDLNWHDSVLYRLIYYNDASEKQLETPLLRFPYYPITFRESGHYADKMLPLGKSDLDLLPRFALGEDNPIHFLKGYIRHQLELQRLKGGYLAEIQSTSIDGLDVADFADGNTPSLVIEGLSSTIARRTNSDRDSFDFRITIHGESMDLDIRRTVEDLVWKVSWLVARKHQWDCVWGVEQSTDIVTQYPDANPRFEDSTFVADGILTFSVIARFDYMRK